RKVSWPGDLHGLETFISSERASGLDGVEFLQPGHGGRRETAYQLGFEGGQPSVADCAQWIAGESGADPCGRCRHQVKQQVSAPGVADDRWRLPPEAVEDLDRVVAQRRYVGRPGQRRC